MTEQQRHDELDNAIESLVAGGSIALTGDADLDAMARLASRLRDLPDPDFKARLRLQLFPEAGSRTWTAFVRRLTMPRMQRVIRRRARAASPALAAIAVLPPGGASA